MCTEIYSGCPSCSAPHDELRYETYGRVSLSYTVDEDGDTDGPADHGDVEDDDCDGHLYCCNCGESEFTIKTDLVPDSCDCEECDPNPDPVAFSYDDEWLVIERVTRYRMNLGEDAPPEILKLNERQSLCRLPVRVDRAKIVMEWVEANRLTDNIYMRLTEPRPAHRSLAVPEPTETEAIA